MSNDSSPINPIDILLAASRSVVDLLDRDDVSVADVGESFDALRDALKMNTEGTMRVRPDMPAYVDDAEPLEWEDDDEVVGRSTGIGHGLVSMLTLEDDGSTTETVLTAEDAVEEIMKLGIGADGSIEGLIAHVAKAEGDEIMVLLPESTVTNEMVLHAETDREAEDAILVWKTMNRVVGLIQDALVDNPADRFIADLVNQAAEAR